jgi:hypothetical protein
MIPEPQRTYVLELLAALGPAAKDFVIAGAHRQSSSPSRTHAVPKTWISF